MRNEEIILDLRRRIVSGEFQPGNALPRRHELLSRYQASNVTVQRAVNQLAQEGFINSRGSKGMFVSDNPPNLFRFGVVLPPNHHELEVNGDTQWRALERAIEEISRERPEYSFALYHIDRYSAPDLPEFRRLVEDLELGLIAGVICSGPLNAEILLSLKPFRVVLHSPPREDVIPAPVMKYNYRQLAQMAVERLLLRGASRVAILLAAQTTEKTVVDMEQCVRAGGIICRPEWVHGIHHLPEGVWEASRLIRLLRAPAQPERPDGLIVFNENLLPPVLTALRECGIVPGREMQIVSHCNIPLTRELPEGLDYIGFNAKSLLLHSVDRLRQSRSEAEGVELIPPEYVMFSPSAWTVASKSRQT